MVSLFLFIGSLSLGLTNMFLIVLFPFKWVWIQYLLHMFLMLSSKPCVYGMTMCPLVYLSLLVSLPSGSPLLVSLCSPLWSFWLFLTLLVSWLFLINLSILSKAPLGCLHLVRASLRCCSSWLRSSVLVQTVLALWVRVLMTLCLATRWWVAVPLEVLVHVHGFLIYSQG